MTPVELKTSIAKLPGTSGVYIFRDTHGTPLYIGKAGNLRSRVSAYTKTTDTRLQTMVHCAHQLDYVITGSDIEALILESQLIKKHKPQFNIVMRDDKQYSFVCFTKEKYSRIFTAHQTKKRDDYCIGPFTDAGALRTTLKHLRRIFPYCTCTQKHHVRCLNAHIGKCLGFCCLKQWPELQDQNKELREYRKNIRAIKDILTGKREAVMKRLEKKWPESAARLQRVFENARFIYAQKSGTVGLEQLRQLLQTNLGLERIEGYDIANIQGQHATGSMVVFVDGQPDKNQYRKFNIKTIEGSNDVAMLGEILHRRFIHDEWHYPNLIIVDGGKGQFNVAVATLQELRVKNLELSKIPVIALTKNDRHRGDHIYIQESRIKNSELRAIPLKDLPEQAKNLILAVDGEAHRFAIAHYRRRHRKQLRK